MLAHRPDGWYVCDPFSGQFSRERKIVARTRTDAYEVVDAAIRAMPGVTTRRMFGAEAFFTTGRMFAFLFDEAIVLKLPESERQDVLDARQARPFLTGERAPFGRWVESLIHGSEAASRAIRLAAAAHALAQSPQHDGPRKRRAPVKRRAGSRRANQEA
jgi:TfoX/Sxy family transcriptional regulator of competence genes